MASDSQVVLDVDAPRVTIVRHKATSASAIWRTCGVLLAVALCAAAAVCFTLNKVRCVNRDVILIYSVLIFTSAITWFLFLSCSFNRRKIDQMKPKVSSNPPLLLVISRLISDDLMSCIREGLKFRMLTTLFLFSLQKSSTHWGRFRRLQRLRFISQVRLDSWVNTETD